MASVSLDTIWTRPSRHALDLITISQLRVGQQPRSSRHRPAQPLSYLRGHLEDVQRIVHAVGGQTHILFAGWPLVEANSDARSGIPEQMVGHS